MNEPNVLIFIVPSQVDGTPNVSNVPKTATIFYHGNRWWFELKIGQMWNNELRQRESNLNTLIKCADPLTCALGPFDFEPVDIEIELFDKGNRSLYSITSINGRKLKTPVQRTRSPIVPIKFDGGAICDAVKIPNGASHQCWLNGSDILESDATNAEPNEAVMLLCGGLAYLDNSQSDNSRVIQINRFQPAESGRLQVTKSIEWQSEYTQTLFDHDRFASSSNVPFVEGGAHYYAFINADEEFTSSNDHNRKWIPTQTGAFLYLFNEDKSPNYRDCLYELSPVALGTSASDQQ